MLGTVFHYAVVAPKDDHADCHAQALGIIAYHESIGYKRGGAYNGHFCIHGGRWISYLGPNQATGDTWANLNLHAWCYLGTTDTPVTPGAADAAYDLTLIEPTGRDQIYPHSYFFNTSCCGDPLREWITAGALPPQAPSPPPPRSSSMAILAREPGVSAFLVHENRSIGLNNDQWNAWAGRPDVFVFDNLSHQQLVDIVYPPAPPVGAVEVEFPSFTVTPNS